MNEKTEKETSLSLVCILITCACIFSATLIGWIFRMMHFPEANIVVVYILSVVLTARFTKGYIYGIVATITATVAFNYVFTDPYFTLSVNDPTYFITFAIMTLTSIITSALTSKVKQNALEAQEKEAEMTGLYQLTNRLTDASDLSEISNIAADTISEILNCNVSCLCFDKDELSGQKSIKALHTSWNSGEEFCDWPICGHESTLGIIRIPYASNSQLSAAQERLLHAMIESIAMAMDRFLSAKERLHSREEAAQERYRGNLLRAISHDLRTPLSGIMGTSEMLMDMTAQEDARYPLAEGIYKDANWLYSLVENILNLTRLQDGKLVLDKQLEAVEEVIGTAIAIVTKRSPECNIAANIPDDILLVPMDAHLIIQVLVNLLDNAIKHTPAGGKITVSVWEEKETKTAVFSVSDCGSGIAPKDLPSVFQIFYTTHGKDADAQRGVGLGLAICESVVNAHGGIITARNRTPEPGAEFSFTLPMEVK